MESSVVVNRALTAVGEKTVYESPGKPVPLTATAWPAGARTDCSGYIAWCLRWSRRVDHPLYVRVNGGWFETTAIHRDGIESTGFFVRLERPRPGALLVYPDHQDSAGKNHQGHVGLVVEADGGSGLTAVRQVVHCSLGSYKSTGDAIRVTGPQPWLANQASIVVWLDEMTF